MLDDIDTDQILLADRTYDGAARDPRRMRRLGQNVKHVEKQSAPIYAVGVRRFWLGICD